MALVLNEEQGMLRDSVNAFLSERAPVAHLRKLRDSRDAHGFDRQLWRQFADQGYSAILVPETSGGLGLEAGIIGEALGRTLAYLKERRQFDRAIGEFQALQHRAAELYIDLELTRALVLGALQAMDQDPAKAALIVAQAKARACTTAKRAVQEGVQMHGGVGMSDEFDIGLYIKRARTLQELLGDAGFHADRVAAMNGY